LENKLLSATSHKIALEQKLGVDLEKVQNPGWYIGGEPNSVLKLDQLDQLSSRVLLAFPDTYPMGMSHNGTRVLYHLLNQESDIWAERAFAPLPDMAAWMKQKDIVLYGLESKSPASDFDVVGISLQTELNYTAIPYLLELAGLQPFAEERSDFDPLVIGGGPCMANPEPVAPFYDLFVIGDAEDLAVPVLRQIGQLRRKGFTRKLILEELRAVPGLYIPSHWPMQNNKYGEAVPTQAYSDGAYNKSAGVRRVWIEKLEAKNYPTSNPVANGTPVHDRYSVEVMRGCTQGCRFCQAGYWYRPNRELSPSDVIALTRKGREQTGDREIGLLSLSTADYSRVHEVIDYFTSDPDFAHIKLSLPSMRANQFGQSLAMKAAKLGGGGSATFAPETGSERLRRIINKTITDQDMINAAEGVFASGVHTLKLYTMIGLPTENRQDMEAFCGLIDALVKVARKSGPRNSINVSIGIFIPKTVTPFQWVPFMDKETVWEHLQIVRQAFRFNKMVKISWADWDTALLEAVYSRGDRNLAPAIYQAYQAGSVLESHTEHLNRDFWKSFFLQNPMYMERALSARDTTEIFSWDLIHAGVAKGYLRAEYMEAFKEDIKPLTDCKWGDCHHCGIPGNYTDIQLADSLREEGNREIVFRQEQAALFSWSHPEDLMGNEKPELLTNTPSTSKPISVPNTPTKIASLYRDPSSGVMQTHTWRIWYSKTSLSRFLAHQVCFSHFEKAFRRLGLPLRYSEGFNPRPQLRMSGATPLGMESREELMLVDIEGPPTLQPNKLIDLLSPLLPGGIELIDCSLQKNENFPAIDCLVYHLVPSPEFIQICESWERRKKNFYVDKKGRERSLESIVLHAGWNTLEKTFEVSLGADASGNTPNPYLVFAALLGEQVDIIRSQYVYKFKTHLKTEGVL